MPVQISRRGLMFSLLTYGEHDLAQRIPQVSQADFDAICTTADRYQARDLATAVVMAAIEVFEGRTRSPTARRRVMADGDPALRVTFTPWPREYWASEFEALEDQSR